MKFALGKDWSKTEVEETTMDMRRVASDEWRGKENSLRLEFECFNTQIRQQAKRCRYILVIIEID